MNKQLVKINNTDLLVKEFNGQRVVTFNDIDMLHERIEGTADRNFRENKKHFIENEDYFVLKKNQNNEIRGLEIPNRGITLLTESGYLMLVKSLQDDLAWQVQRELVNNYFRVKSNFNNQLPSINPVGLNDVDKFFGGTQAVLQMFPGMVNGLNKMIGLVQDTVKVKDSQIDKALDLVGMRSKNVTTLTNHLKKVLGNKHRMNVTANMEVYLKAKRKIFEEYGVTKWEEIPVLKYNEVMAFIEEAV